VRPSSAHRARRAAVAAAAARAATGADWWRPPAGNGIALRTWTTIGPTVNLPGIADRPDGGRVTGQFTSRDLTVAP
jgi:hypothetical protein